MTVTSNRLKELLIYSSESGEFTWRVARGSVRIGKRAGNIDTQGYRTIRIDKVLYYAHRLVWFYIYEAWPMGELDHINRDTTDNRVINLRMATRTEQNANKKCRVDSTTGLKGVGRCKSLSNPFTACIQIRGERIHLGVFSTAQEAHVAYVVASKKYFGEFSSAS